MPSQAITHKKLLRRCEMRNIVKILLVMVLGFSFVSSNDACEEIWNLDYGDKVSLWLHKDGKKIQIDESVVTDKRGKLVIIMGHKLSYTQAEIFSEITCKNNEIRLHSFASKDSDKSYPESMNSTVNLNYKEKQWILLEKRNIAELIITKKTSLASN